MHHENPLARRVETDTPTVDGIEEGVPARAPVRRSRARLAAYLALAAIVGVAVGGAGMWAVEHFDKKSSSTPKHEEPSTMASQVKTATKSKPDYGVGGMEPLDKSSSTRIKRSFLAVNGPTSRYAKTSARTEIRDFSGNHTLYSVTFDVVARVPFGRFTDGNATQDHRHLVMRIEHLPTGKVGHLFPMDISTSPNAKASNLAAFVGPDGAVGMVHVSAHGEVLLHDDKAAREEWDSFFASYFITHLGAITDEMIEDGLLTEAEIEAQKGKGSRRRLDAMGRDVGSWVGQHIGSWAGSHAGSWAGGKIGSDIGSDVGGIAGGAIGADVGGPVGYEVGRFIGSDVGRWAGEKVGSWAGGKIGGDVGGDFGSDVGGDWGNDW